MLSLEYVAGFFDGEGSIGVYKNGKKRGCTLRSQLVQNKSGLVMEMLWLLRAEFGGEFTERNNGGKIAVNWQLSGANACRFLTALLPYLRLKREQAKVAIEWYASRPKPIRDSRGRIVKITQSQIDKDTEIEMTLKKMKGA